MRLGLVFHCIWWVACQIGCSEAPNAATTAPLSPKATTNPPASSKTAVSKQIPFDVSTVLARVRHGFRARGAEHHGGDATYRVSAQAGRIELTPFHRSGAGDHQQGDSLTLETLSVARGGQPLAVRKPETETAENGSLRIVRGDVTEVLANTDAGLEQSFELERRPEGHGALAVRIAVHGQTYRGESAGGLHFVGSKNRLGFRYGNAAFVDASGRRNSVKARFSDGAIVLEVPGAVLDAASYPAVLDPVVGPEFGMDQPAVGGIQQTSQAVATNADGTALVVWSVNYGQNADLYGARVSADGTLLDPLGIPLSTASREQTTPSVASDGTSWFVAWREGASGFLTGVYGTRVGADGTVQDPNGITISATSVDGPAVAYDGTNFLVAWDAGSTISGARVDGSGTLLDATPMVIGSVDVWLHTFRLGLSLGFDGDHWVAVWSTYRTATHSVDVVGAHLSSTAAPIDNFTLSTASGYQMLPRVACRGGGACFATWEDSATWQDPTSIYGTRFVPGGALDPSGISIATSTPVERHFPTVSWDGTNWVVGWVLGPLYDLHGVEGARVATDGTLLDSTPITLAAQAWSVAMAPSLDRMLVVWGDTGVVHGTRGAFWTGTSTTPSPFVISANYANTYNPQVAASDTQWLVVWSDSRDTPNATVYGTRVSPNGVILDPNGIAISGPLHEGFQRFPAVASDGTNWLVTWEDLRYVDVQFFGDVYGTRVTADGIVPDATPTLIRSNAILPHVAFNGSSWLVAWGGDAGAGAARVALDGSVLDPQGIPLIVNGSGWWQGGALAGGAGQWLVASGWWDPDTSSGNVYGQRIADDGTVIDATPILIAVGSNLIRVHVSAAYGDGQWLVAWENNNASSISAARVDDTGAVLDPSAISISSTGTYTATAYDGNQWLVTWWQSVGGSQSSDIAAARVNAAGEVLDSPGFIVTAGPGAETEVALAGRNGRWLVVYNQTAGTVLEAKARIVQTECVAAGATDATSDGIADDCDGSFDEDYLSTPTSCGAGGCATTGATSCVDGSVLDSCTPDPADDDADGTPNCDDGCPTDARKTAAGTCGCGNADTDSDSDGIDDCVDACPSVPAMTSDGCPPSGTGGASGSGGTGAGTGGAGGSGGTTAGTEGTSGAAGTGGISVGGAGGGGSGGTSGTGGSATAGEGGAGGEGGLSGEAGSAAGGEPEGGNTHTGGTSSAGTGNGGGGNAGTHTGGGGAPPPSDDDGCGCRVPREAPSRPWSTALVAVVIGLGLRRRASRAV